MKQKRLLRKLILQELISEAKKRNDFKGPSSYDFDLVFDKTQELPEDTIELTKTDILDPDRTSFSSKPPPSEEDLIDTDLYDTELFDDDRETEDSLAPYDSAYDIYEPWYDDQTELEDTEIIGSKFGDRGDDHEANAGLKDFLASQGSDMSPMEHRKQLLDKIRKLKKGLRENKYRGKARIQKLIELSIVENTLRSIL